MDFRAKIVQHLPQLAITTYREVSGWDNVACIVNEQMVFRFPTTVENRLPIVAEGKLLARLQPMLAIAVPQFQFLCEDGEAICSYYEMVKGEPLTPDLLHALPVGEQEQTAKAIAAFMTAMHQLTPDGDAFRREHDECYWQSHLDEVEEHIYPLLTAAERVRVAEFFQGLLEQVRRPDVAKAILHGDISPSHLLYDKERHRLNGVIDFGDAAIGDPAYEFYRLYDEYGADFARKVYRYYPLFAADSGFYTRMAQYYSKHPVFHELLYAIELQDGEKIAAERAKIAALFGYE